MSILIHLSSIQKIKVEDNGTGKEKEGKGLKQKKKKKPSMQYQVPQLVTHYEVQQNLLKQANILAA